MSVKSGRSLYLTDSIGRVAQQIYIAPTSPAPLHCDNESPIFYIPHPFPRTIPAVNTDKQPLSKAISQWSLCSPPSHMGFSVSS